MIQSKLKEDNKNIELNEFQKLLADPNQSKYIDLAKKISPEGRVVQRESELGVKLVKDKYSKLYNPTFTRKDILDECLKFNMSFIQAKYFKGDLTPVLMKKIDDFLTSNTGIIISDYDLCHKLYILAPMDNKTSINQLPKENIKDPLFFIETERGYYTLIDGEKNYVNLFNRRKGMVYYSKGSMRLCYTAEHYLVLLIFGLCLTYIPLHMLIVALVSIPIAFITSSVRLSFSRTYKDVFTPDEKYFNKYKFSDFLNYR